MSEPIKDGGRAADVLLVSRTAPEVATPRLMAGTLTVLYAFGGLIGLLAALGSQPGAGRATLLVVSFGALASAAVSGRWGARWPRALFHVPVGMGTVLVAIAAAVSPDPATAVIVAAIMAFIAVDAYSFFPRALARVHLAAALLAASGALLLRGDVAPATVLAVDTLVGALGVVAHGLVNRASRANRDPLTGLLNRRGFDEALQDSLAGAARTGQPLTAVLLDLDHFKQINDSAGHAAGDLVLCRVADVWRPALPPGAAFARHGGDEFSLLLPGVPGSYALALVRRLCALHPDVGVSCGVADHHPGETAAQLMRRADRALYDAKSAGRGRCELDGGGTSELSRDLAAALAAGDVQVHYQPVVDLSSGALTGVEALARWTHPQRGPVPPQEFIAVAEQNGLIITLGEHVLRTACTELAGLRADAGGSLGLGVNVSGRELCDPDYPDRVRAVVTQAGWPASDVVLEVTESLLEASSSAAVDALHTLRAAGLRVAIDDFGTGYSSLSRLDTVPADVLKLDHSFIAPITTSPRRAQMLHSIAEMARTLGLSLVAEGVETEEQDAVLRRAGCQYAQGWHYGRPVPVAQLTGLLGRRLGDQLAGAAAHRS